MLTVARYDDLSTRNLLSADSEFLYCQSPGCSSGQMHDASTEGYIFRCTECGYGHCTSCKVAFHTDETCTRYQERISKEREEELRIQKKQEEASLAEVTKVSVACPGCGANIQKSHGCDHMTCEPLIHPGRTFTNKDLRQKIIMPLRILLCMSCAVCWSRRYSDQRQHGSRDDLQASHCAVAQLQTHRSSC